MKIIYNRIEYLTSEIEVDEKELKEEFYGDIISYINYYEDEANNKDDRITREGVFDIDIEIIDEY